MLRGSFSTLILAAFSAAALFAANDPFVGTWKLNLAKSQFTGEQMKIEDLGQNRYRFTSGADTDTIAADGTDQPIHYGRTQSITRQGPNIWKMVVKKDGKVQTTGTWTLSADSKTVTFKGSNMKPDGTASDFEGTVKRIGGGSGWGGTWESTQIKIGSPDETIISTYQGDGLSFNTPAYQDVLNMKFDGKDYPETGPNVAPGSASSGKRVNAHMLEVTDKIQGKVMDHATFQVSQDGKTLTITIHETGQPKPIVAVYDKQ